MATPTMLADFVQPTAFINTAARATTTADVEKLLAALPIVSEHDYSYDESNPEAGWQPGKFHWLPVGRERGNAGRIKQANYPVNPIAERAINGMEALIEQARSEPKRGPCLRVMGGAECRPARAPLALEP